MAHLAAPRLRSQIHLGTRVILKVKQPGDAHDRVAGFLRTFTAFTGWDRATLRVALPLRAPAHDRLLGERDGAAQDLDRAALLAHGVELDDLCERALTRFGAADFGWHRQSLGSHDCHLAWSVTQALAPSDWLAFCGEHARARVDDLPRVAIHVGAKGLEPLDLVTRAPLPFCAAHHYPPLYAGAAGGLPCEVEVTLELPERVLMVAMALPFEEPDADFIAYVRALEVALGQELPRSHWRHHQLTRAGNAHRERKLAW